MQINQTLLVKIHYFLLFLLDIELLNRMMSEHRTVRDVTSIKRDAESKHTWKISKLSFIRLLILVIRARCFTYL